VLSCPVGIGAGGTPTPAGATTIAQRVRNPEWRDPATGKVHPPHSPGNLLGAWWLGFAAGDDGRFRSIGCHGWTGDDPARWLGQEGSRGCIRMRQDDIADLAALVVPGVVVEVR
jgi:lipoprotein-anchoring transpeptidase ErfK/SrfK